MPKLVELETFHSDTGDLTVFEKVLPGTIKRAFYIYGAGLAPRGGHRHRKAWNALVCLCGQCRVYVHNGQEEKQYLLDTPTTCLILEPQDWHRMDHFSPDAVLLGLSNEYYDKEDYIYEPYPSTGST